MMEEREAKQTKASELQAEMHQEIDALNEKHKEVLARYEVAAAEMKHLLNKFYEKWEVPMEAYRKESKAIARKYKKLAREL